MLEDLMEIYIPMTFETWVKKYYITALMKALFGE